MLSQSQRANHRKASSKYLSKSLNPPEMTSLHQCLNQESTVESLYSRWGSSSRVVGDRPPSQPLSRRQMYGGPSSGCSGKQSHKDPEMGSAHRRGNAFERLQQQSVSKWTSGSGVITDRPPSQPLSRRGSSVQRIQQSDSRWSSGSQPRFDMALSQALSDHRMLVGPSSGSALEHSVEMKNHDLFEITIKTLFASTLMARAPNVTGTGLQCAARTA
jgi:hypothetical protein